MSATTRVFSTGRTLAMSLAFGLAMASVAAAQPAVSVYAIGQDAGSSSLREGLVRDAARSKPSTPLTAEQLNSLEAQFKLGRNDAFGDASAPQPLQAMGESGARVASTAPMVGGDILGAHGAQDALANQIYAPGSRPVGW